MDDNRKPVSTRLLRATDGLTVDGSVNAGPLLRDARWFRIYGRTVLLNEGTGDQPRVVRLYEDWGKAERAALWKARLGMPDLPADVFARP